MLNLPRRIVDVEGNAGMGIRTMVYVDGFNLYHGLRDLGGRKWLWLDLEALGRRLCREVIAAFPPRRHSDELGNACHGRFKVSESKVRQSQLPPQVSKPDGTTLVRPAYWA